MSEPCTFSREAICTDFSYVSVHEEMLHEPRWRNRAGDPMNHDYVWVKPSNTTFWDRNSIMHNNKFLPTVSLVGSVLQSMVEAQILRPLLPHECTTLCEDYNDTARRRDILYEAEPAVGAVINQLCLTWPGLWRTEEHVLVDPSKRSLLQKVHVWVYRHKPTTLPRREFIGLCQCGGPQAHATTDPQIVLLEIGQWETEFFRWLSPADLADGALDQNDLCLVEHYMCSVGEPMLVCKEGRMQSKRDLCEKYAGEYEERFCAKCNFYLLPTYFQDSSNICILCSDRYWRCRECRREYGSAAFSISQWRHRKERDAICQSCIEKQQLYVCELCGLKFDRNGFTESMWHYRHSEELRTLCKTCFRPPCTNPVCATCKSCRDPVCSKQGHCKATLVALNSKCLPTMREELDTWLCANCERFGCELCGNEFDCDGFTASMWCHRYSQQRTLCKTCCRPPCTNPLCATCERCRDPSCSKQGHCKATLIALNSNCLPTVLEELDTWLCANCERFGCELCGNEFDGDGFTASMWCHRYSQQRTLCKTCCRPPCTNPGCPTCNICRDPTCSKRGRCKAALKALHPKCLPTKVQELDTWLCDNGLLAQGGRRNVASRMMHK